MHEGHTSNSSSQVPGFSDQARDEGGGFIQQPFTSGHPVSNPECCTLHMKATLDVSFLPHFWKRFHPAAHKVAYHAARAVAVCLFPKDSSYLQHSLHGCSDGGNV